MRFPLPSLLLAVVLTGCATQAQQAPKSTEKAAAAKPGRQAKKAAPTTKASTEAAPAIILSKTPCLGRCPHYDATIYPDGRVVYEGFQHAPVEGKREFTIPVSTVNAILAQAQALRFQELQALYSDGATDMPSTSVRIQQPGGPAKVVSVETGAPAELMSLLQYIEKQITDGVGATGDR